ncbi:MAG: hypothetical protein ACRCVT_12385 [Leadbetterella sp.]
MMKNKIVATAFFLVIFGTVYSQDFRTYNNFALGTNFSKKINNVNFTYGQMIERRSHDLVLRGLVGFSLKLQSIKPLQNFSYTESFANDLNNFRNIGLSIPIGLEVGHKNIAIGLSQDIIGLNFGQKLDSTDLQIPVNYSAEVKRFPNVLQKKNSLGNNVYIAITISETFTLKIGAQTEKIRYDFFNDKDRLYQTVRNKSTGFYASIRINIEK